MSKPDTCEWNPAKDLPAQDGDEMHAPAELILGNGDWRLCRDCASLPRFRRYRRRKEIAVAQEVIGE